MKQNKIFAIIMIMSVLAFIFAGCGFLPETVTGAITGQVKIPASGEMSKDISGWVPAAGAEVTVVDTNGVTHTVTTDEDGYYSFENIAVKPNTIITATVEADGKMIVLKKVIPVAVTEDENYDSGTMTPEDTALALVVEGLVKVGMDPAEVDLDEIKDTNSFEGLAEQIATATEEGNNIIEDPDITDGIDEVVDEMINPPAPSTPSQPSAEPAFVAVTEITGVPTEGIVREEIDLTIAITNADATNRTIVWTVKDAGSTGVDDISNGKFTPTAAGTLVVTATVTNGTAVGTDYTKDFTITIAEPTFALSFAAATGAEALDGATITVYSDAERTTEVENLDTVEARTYYYTIEKTGFVTQEDSVEITDADKEVEITLVVAETPKEHFVFNKTTGEITGYSNLGPKDVVIPAKIEDVDVKSIGNSAFSHKNLTSVTIPDLVTSIGIGAFSNNGENQNSNNITESPFGGTWIIEEGSNEWTKQVE